MPFVANTPESLLGRADSKNPSVTCRGITSSGRPCRRPLARPAQQQQPPSSAGSLLLPRRRGAQQLQQDDPSDERLYCWQHKDQALQSARSSPGPRGAATPILEERTSLDTLADRLGIVDLQEKQTRRKPADGGGGARKQAASSNGGGPQKSSLEQAAAMRKKKKKQTQQLKCCFCFSIPIEEINEQPPARPQPRPVQQTPSSIPAPPHRFKQQQQQQAYTASAFPSKTSNRSRKSIGAASHTAQLKDLIPDTLDSATASALMAELARPFTESEEPGYIYMFWLTPASAVSAREPAPVDAARSLLAPPASAAAARTTARRPSDVVSRFAGPGGRKTMLLKIGRAANVHRRMNQWQRQCGHDIELLRYYPYLPAPASASASAETLQGRCSSSSSSAAPPRVTAHCHRVERLVHIELAGLGLRAASMEACGACGREHREWFEVRASREGIRAVDEVIRRWVAWDEGTA